MSHFLTRLELIGFKSFADKTTLEFPGGITAVVGPNGSGKSNVIDAIRWLLGEREARNLRGGRVEDLIFAGTPKRPRVGQAQASLYFENHNKFFPVDFEEVVITRIVSRDGTNKYLINKAEVRLKDLVDFFAQARLGSRGITVVTQGNSDMFIRSLPRERREMIEEVLGLKEYQIKKTDAERRLAHTSENLLKAEALIQELAPHLRSLKRQTSRWERRGEIETELRELENVFFGRQWMLLGEQLRSIEKDSASHKKIFDALLKEKETAERQIQAVEGGGEDGLARRKAIRERTKELIERRSAAQKELGRIEATIEAEQHVPESGGMDAGKIRNTLKEIRDLLQESLHGDFEILRDTVLDVLQHLETLIEESENTDADAEKGAPSFPDLSQELRKLETLLGNFEKELELLGEQERNLEETQEHFYVTFKDNVARLERARDAIEQWERESQSKNLERERIMMRREELTRHIVQAGRNVSEFESWHGEEEGGEESGDVMERRMFRLRGELAAIGEVDEAIVREAKETEERCAFLEHESEDLKNARDNLRSLIADLDKKVTVEFETALRNINREFQKFFELMFGGGTARLIVEQKSEARNTKPETNIGEPLSEGVGDGDETGSEALGVEVKISLPRKRLTSLEVLSGGERSLVGIAALFALISVSPPPFLVLDEIDAALDDRNTRRFAEMLKEFAKETQFVVVTHNRATMEVADVLYGVTLGEDGASKILSMKLE